MQRCRFIPWVRKIPGGGHGNLLQCSCLENPVDRGAWWATVHGVTKSWTWLSDFNSLLHCRWIIYHLSQKPHSQLWRVADTHNSHICLHSGNRNGHNPVLTQCFSNSDGKPKLRTIKFASFTFPLNLNSHLSPLISHLRIPSQGCLPGNVCSGTAQSKEGGIKPLHSPSSMGGQLEFQIHPHLENKAHSLRNEGRVFYVCARQWACMCEYALNIYVCLCECLHVSAHAHIYRK